MEEFIYYNKLFDIYESLLTEKECLTFRDYYQEDYSLSEIASLKNVSRSAVQKTIKTVIDKLKSYEEKLHIYEKQKRLSEALELNDCKKIKEIIESVL